MVKFYVSRFAIAFSAAALLAAPQAGEAAFLLPFTADALSSEQRSFLERTNQLRAPPLVEQGAAWVVSLEGAPPGAYPFHCITHGERGRLTVVPPEGR